MKSDLGDWGKQYGLLALAYQRNGDEEALQKNPIDHLFRLYVQINAEMSAEKEAIEAQKKEGKDVSALEANSLDEQARQYFKRMVSVISLSLSLSLSFFFPVFTSAKKIADTYMQTDRDEEVLAQWKRFRDLSIARYKGT